MYPSLIAGAFVNLLSVLNEQIYQSNNIFKAAAILCSCFALRSPLSGYHHKEWRLRAQSSQQWSDEYEQQQVRVRGQGPPRGWSPPARAAARRGGTSPRSCRVRGNTGGDMSTVPGGGGDTETSDGRETIIETTDVIASVR